jgi:hypothetical protein
MNSTTDWQADWLEKYQITEIDKRVCEIEELVK